MSDIYEDSLSRHKQLAGKLEISLKDTLDSAAKLNLYYTPGVAAVSSYIAKHPDAARDYTWKGNNVAIVSDGSAVLGLGNIGPLGALPVMEGKAMLFKQFANIDSVPIVLSSKSPDDIIATVTAIAPSFGGINLEDIKAPECFYVEEELKKRLGIPVFHDDQHGTAVVVLAGLINAAKVTDRNLKLSKVVIIGAGAAGSATAKLLYRYGITNIVVVDRTGVIHKSRDNLNSDKKYLAEITNPDEHIKSLDDSLIGADVVIGVSQPGMIKPTNVEAMADNPIIFAMANPEPEIMPDKARQAGAAVIATGRSDLPNQVNNALAFPGIFRGALDNKISNITDEHKLSTAKVIAGLVENPTAENIIPSVIDKRLVPAIASVIK